MKTKIQNNVIEMSDIRDNSKPDMLEWRNFITQEMKGCSGNVQQIEHSIVKHLLLGRAEKDQDQGMYCLLAVMDVLKALKEVHGPRYGI